ncbi:hypothetical protein BV511_04165 [Methylorubrum extorquens]|nr:hypothetical protein BV511_04165 [Methylorubrum extorquens]
MRRGGEPVTPERIERALRLVAYLVARDEGGEVYLPILDRLEEELAESRRRERPRDRALRLLSTCPLHISAASVR